MKMVRYPTLIFKAAFMGGALRSLMLDPMSGLCVSRRNEAGQSLRCVAAFFSPWALGLQKLL